jgi:cytoskeletal protein RodZ
MGQLTFVLNMFFGLSVGALAFSFSLVRDKEFLLSACPKLTFQIGLISLCIAVFVSCAAVMSRLFDYRYTAKKIRSDEKEEVEESAVYKYKSSFLGRLTWRLLWVQVVTLGIGLLGLVVGVLSGYSDRIW